MNSKTKSMFTAWLAPIVAIVSRPPTRRDIVLPTAKPNKPSSVAAPTIIHLSALSAVTSYQTTSNEGRRAIVANNVKTLQLSDGDAGQCQPLNRGGLTLSRSLALGRTYHPLCRGTFVQKVQHGYYAYERWTEWQTCALAAAYAGIFGPGEIEKPEFSYSQACWLLSQVLGYDPSKLTVEGPTGRRGSVAEEMVKLTDDNLWNRRAVAAWLGSVGL